MIDVGLHARVTVHHQETRLDDDSHADGAVRVFEIEWGMHVVGCEFAV